MSISGFLKGKEFLRVDMQDIRDIKKGIKGERFGDIWRLKVTDISGSQSDLFGKLFLCETTDCPKEHWQISSMSPSGASSATWKPFGAIFRRRG